MKYNNLSMSKHKRSSRVGRGIAAGQGKTAGRGTKGQKARTGFKKRPGFEGGQNPLMQRLPKLHGFKSLKSSVETVHTSQLEQFSGKTVTNDLLVKAGIVSSEFSETKLLVKGNLTKKVTVKLHGASQAAIEQIEKAGGSFEKVAKVAARESKVSKPKSEKIVAD